MRLKTISLSGAVLLMVSSCAATDGSMSEPVESSPLTVTFDVSPDRTLSSRAGNEESDPVPTRALMYVFDKTTSEIVTTAKAGDAIEGGFQFSIELDRNHRYDIAFWADCEGYVIDADKGLDKITYINPQSADVPLVAYTNRESDFAPRDAPYPIKLTHAVAKLVIRENSGLNVDDEVGVSFTRKNYSYSAIEGAYTIVPGTSEEKVVFTHKSDGSSGKADLITTYMLAPNDKQKEKSMGGPAMMVDDFRVSYTPNGGESSHREISNVAFKSNYRTVIQGNLVDISKLTQTFTVSIDDTWLDMDAPNIDEGTDPGSDPDNPAVPAVPEIVLTAPGTLTEAMVVDAVGTGNALKIAGPMNDKDFGVLRAYLSADGTGKDKRLSLDLSNGEFTTMPKFVFSNGDFYGKDNPNPVIGLKEIDLPEGLTEIPEGAFSDCFNLERVGLSSTVAKMWGIAFYRTALKRLDGQSVTTIYENVFESCHELTCVVVGNLAEIRMAAFRDCIKLETFDMTRCTKVPAASHNIFGNNNTETPQLTIYVGSADILNTLSNDAKWNITKPKWAIGSPGK